MAKFDTIVRLFRPVLHGIIIILVFNLAYKIRLVTDLIPGVQLNIPIINYQETLIYSILATLSFVGLGIIKGLYELHKPIQKYFQTFTKVWLYWLVTITFLAYFGQGFVFFFGISRFIIVISAFFIFFILFFVDQIWNYIELRYSRTGSKKIIIIGSDTLESHKAIEEIRDGFALKTEFARIKDIVDIQLDSYFMVVAVGSFAKEILQDIFEKTRYSSTRFYHISEGFFLEDVVYSPESINNIIALEYKNSTLDGRALVWKRLFDIFGSIALIIIFSPFMILVAILIRLNSKGPIIYAKKSW